MSSIHDDHMQHLREFFACWAPPPGLAVFRVVIGDREYEIEADGAYEAGQIAHIFDGGGHKLIRVDYGNWSTGFVLGGQP